MDSLQVLALDYVIAVYPLFTVLVTYILVQMHARGYRLIVWLWKPFHLCTSRVRRQWNIKTSLIDTFASFLLLSYVKFLSVSFDLLVPIPLYYTNGTMLSSLFLYHNGSMQYFGSQHLPYGLLAVGITLVFVVIPLLLLLVYPCRCFQRLLGSCGVGCFTLLTFMDVFQGSYKNGKKPNARLSPLHHVLAHFRCS